jgi:hypothetical protein
MSKSYTLNSCISPFASWRSQSSPTALRICVFQGVSVSVEC